MSRVPADPRSGWSELLRIGGVARVAAGVLSVALLAIVVTVADGAPPRDAARVVDLLVRHGRLIEAVAVIYLVVDLCLVVALPALYVALRPVNRTWPLLAGFPGRRRSPRRRDRRPVGLRAARVGRGLRGRRGAPARLRRDARPPYTSTSGALRRACTSRCWRRRSSSTAG
jgi:hypothetical protein